jgi:hypothetical protein
MKDDFQKKRNTRITQNDEIENLGLDADRSADEGLRYDNDNDIISHNPDGEDDSNDSNQQSGTSPLDDK